MGGEDVHVQPMYRPLKIANIQKTFMIIQQRMKDRSLRKTSSKTAARLVEKLCANHFHYLSDPFEPYECFHMYQQALNSSKVLVRNEEFAITIMVDSKDDTQFIIRLMCSHSSKTFATVYVSCGLLSVFVIHLTMEMLRDALHHSMERSQAIQLAYHPIKPLTEIEDCEVLGNMT